jgi:uncharacterized membrane protein YeaQ/YmgE (transglycosylase-associated protein family)
MLAFNGNEISLVQLFVWLVVAMISGIIAETLYGYSHAGLFSTTVLGLLGALFGTWLASTLQLPALLTLTLFGVQVELIWCTVGSLIVIALLQSMRYRGGGGRSRRRSRD